MYNILHRITEERRIESNTKAAEERGEPLTDDEWKEYCAVMREKRNLLSLMHSEIADLDSLLQSMQD